MPQSDKPQTETAEHIDATIHSLTVLRDEHRRTATPLQRLAIGLTRAVSRPGMLLVLSLLVAGWIAVNSLLPVAGLRAFDPAPFFWLDGAVSLASLYMVFMILASQRTEDELAQRRELLSLELAVLSEQKTAKLIGLLEEFRRDSPHLKDRVDQEAEAMARPLDPVAVIGAISEKRAASEG